jgi:DNA-binding NarL/FixJ family response regulator
MPKTRDSCVVLADKSLGMMEGVKGLLEAEFDSVIMVSDRKSLISTITGMLPDLVVVDISLPGGRGINLARMIREKNPGLKIIALGFYDDIEIARSVMEAGASAYVLKRSAGQDLLTAVASIKNGRVFISPSIDA